MTAEDLITVIVTYIIGVDTRSIYWAKYKISVSPPHTHYTYVIYIDIYIFFYALVFLSRAVKKLLAILYTLFLQYFTVHL